LLQEIVDARYSFSSRVCPFVHLLTNLALVGARLPSEE
jgi:hypothetical protein